MSCKIIINYGTKTCHYEFLNILKNFTSTLTSVLTAEYISGALDARIELVDFRRCLRQIDSYIKI